MKIQNFDDAVSRCIKRQKAEVNTAGRWKVYRDCNNYSVRWDSAPVRDGVDRDGNQIEDAAFIAPSR